MSESTIEVAKPILDKNDRLAADLRRRYAEHKVCVVNLLSGPGSGKTSTILATIAALSDRYNIAVIEGQINTGGLCHLEGAMIERALDVLDLDKTDLIIIENVGNLVCTVEFDLGESLRAMILSVPEGHDKPLKYPGIFQSCEAIIVNKIDTLPVFDFDEAAFAAEIDQLNPHARTFKISATKGTGVQEWADFLAQRIEAVKAGKSE